MIEIGRIARIKDGVATVRFYRKGDCDRCLMCSATKDGGSVELDVKNSLELNAGDCVKVEVYKKKTYRASIAVYLIPLVLTALGAGLGSLASIAASILLAIAGIVVGLAFALPIDVCVLRKSSAPKMIEVCAEIDYLNSKPQLEDDSEQDDNSIKKK